MGESGEELGAERVDLLEDLVFGEALGSGGTKREQGRKGVSIGSSLKGAGRKERRLHQKRERKEQEKTKLVVCI